MAIPSVPPQMPVLVLPHQEAGREEFIKSRRYDPTLIGILAVIVVVIAIVVVFAIIRMG